MSDLATVYQQQGSIFIPVKEMNLPKPLPKLPPFNFIVNYDIKIGFHLELTENFELPTKMYGNAVSLAARIINTYERRNSNTGVMLIGEKGSGKSMTAKAIARLAQAQGYPVLLINRAYGGDEFNNFLQQINQPCVVLFDEFEKTYEPKDQPAMLTVLDGVFQSQKLFVMTCNSQSRLDVNLNNRPGRIHYWIEYKGLTTKEIQEYAEDKITERSLVDQIVKTASVFQGQMNFDMLRALVEESLMYRDRPVIEHLKVLNLHPAYVQAKMYVFEVKVNGVAVPEDHYWPKKAKVNPARVNTPGSYDDNDIDISILSTTFQKMAGKNEKSTSAKPRKSDESSSVNGLMERLESFTNSLGTFKGEELRLRSTDITSVTDDDDDDDGRDDREFIEFTASDLVNLDVDKGCYTFKCKYEGQDISLTLTREEERDSRTTAYEKLGY